MSERVLVRQSEVARNTYLRLDAIAEQQGAHTFTVEFYGLNGVDEVEITKSARLAVEELGSKSRTATFKLSDPNAFASLKNLGKNRKLSDVVIQTEVNDDFNLRVGLTNDKGQVNLITDVAKKEEVAQELMAAFERVYQSVECAQSRLIVKPETGIPTGIIDSAINEFSEEQELFFSGRINYMLQKFTYTGAIGLFLHLAQGLGKPLSIGVFPRSLTSCYAASAEFIRDCIDNLRNPDWQYRQQIASRSEIDTGKLTRNLRHIFDKEKFADERIGISLFIPLGKDVFLECISFPRGYDEGAYNNWGRSQFLRLELRRGFVKTQGKNLWVEVPREAVVNIPKILFREPQEPSWLNRNPQAKIEAAKKQCVTQFIEGLKVVLPTEVVENWKRQPYQETKDL